MKGILNQSAVTTSWQCVAVVQLSCSVAVSTGTAHSSVCR